MRFLAAEPIGSVAAPEVIIQGVPYDRGVSWRPGAAAAPAAIRDASDSIESYSPLLKDDLAVHGVVDVGDVALFEATGAAMVERVALATEQLARTGALVVTLGGDHSISMGTARGFRSLHPNLAHVVFDAHLDMRAHYEGDAWSHACGTRRMAEAGPTIALGIRSGSREEFRDADDMLAGYHEDVTPTRAMRRAVEGRPVFVSLDLDVLDPSVMPGTGNPEPGGVTYRALRDALLSLEGLDIVGIDLVECAPPLDPSGISPIVAAELAREGILRFLRAAGDSDRSVG